ncbi:MAG: hypothetical protein JM58_07120 [Peptococcaceae bacterium BICA1-8]|nr:MAG: hypothetical protein JM58_07120 [Peptococcaceae bacterium BICA1-8]
MIERRTENTYPPQGFLQVSPTPQELADAIVSPGTKPCLVGVAFSGLPEQGAIFTTPLQGFPTDGNSFTVLSNGIASLTPGVATTYETQDLGGVTIPAGNPQGSPDGLTSFDVVTLTLTFQLPANPGVLSFDWKFGTEENPSFTTTYPDYFRADVTTSTGFTNIALLPGNIPVTVTNAAPFSNAVGGDSSNPTPPFPTPNDVVYNAVTTNIFTATFDLSTFGGETITLALRVGDVHDGSVNSAAFIDNVNISNCKVTRGVSFF